MIKRLCITTAPAWAIGSTRENCVHSAETDFVLYSADTFDELSTVHVHPSRSIVPKTRDLMTARGVDRFLNFSSSPKSRCRDAKSIA